MFNWDNVSFFIDLIYWLCLLYDDVIMKGGVW